MFYVPSPVSNGIIEGIEAIDCKLSSDSIGNKYQSEWRFLTSEKDLNVIKNHAIKGNLRTSSIRSVYWRVCLGIFPISSPTEWLNSIRESREKYLQIKNDFTLDPRTTSNLPDDNPLSQDENSIWNRYFCDTELKRVIRQDVVRTSPERAFFQQTYIQDMMINILFYYARQNPNMCYRQGMHEILAPLLIVMCEDFTAFEQAKQTSVINSFISEIMDLNYLESDLFYLFSFIMLHMAKYYEVDDIPTPSGHFPLPNFVDKNNTDISTFESAIYSILNTLRDNLLSTCDRQLYNHLKELNIPFTAFGIRWLRLLYGREFSLKDLLFVWDAIFAVHSDLDLVNYIVIAMLIAIRDKLLNSDYMECLNYLMKYPETVDVKFVIDYALYIKDPMLYPKPTQRNEQLSQLGNVSSKINQLKNSSNKHLNITKKLKNLKMNSTRKNIKENDFNFVDDYSTKTFEMVVTELKHMRVVMSLCKLKLFQYHEILAASISSDDLKAQQALTGIHELCTLLEIDHFSLKSPPNNPGVETGREAEDIQVPYATTSSDTFSYPTVDAVALYLPPPNSEIDMKIFKCTECETTDLSKFPVEDPLKLNKQ